METDKAEQLWNKFLAGDCTEEEKALFDSWLISLMQSNDQVPCGEEMTHAYAYLYAGIENKMRRGSKLSIARWLMPVAAAFMVILSYYLFQLKSKPEGWQQQAAQIHSGGNAATLTLAGGRKIDLNMANSGTLDSMAGIRIIKTTDGQVVYQLRRAKPGDSLSKNIPQNTISTPRGGRYEIMLPDGTHVWLNAASTLVFPVQFSVNGRAVKLTGEGYFEVAKNPSAPFTVTAGTQQITVLGTHFNVKSYGEEKAAVTTLYEGLVQVTHGDQQRTIHPGEIARSSQASVGISVGPSGELGGPAWRTGKIYFKDASVEEILRQASRWYDVDVEYQGQVPAKTFTGGIFRNADLSVLLEVLKSSGLTFKIQKESNRTKLIVISL